MQRSRFFLSLAVLTAGLLYLGAWHRADHAHGVTPSAEGLMAPLDDAYIFGQYARQALRGEWLHYTPGAPISTGVSSASWLLALTALMGLGWPLTWAAWALGLACLAWSVLSLLRLSQRLFPRLPDWALPVLALAHASTVANFFQGMDTGLLVAALLATAEAALDPRARARFWGLGLLLAFTRPEGQVALPFLALARAWPISVPARWRALAFGLGLAALPSLGLWAISGSAVPDSVRPKSAATAALPLGEHLQKSGHFALQVTSQLMMGLVPPESAIGYVGDKASGNDPARHFPPLTFVLAALGLFLSWRFGDQRPWWTAMGLLWLATLFALSWGLPVGWHRHRYLTPLWPLLILGIAAVLQAAQDERVPQAKLVRSAVLTLWLGWGVLQWPWFLRATEQSATNYAAGNREAAFALAGRPSGIVAVEDAGLIAYYGGHPTCDLLGVTDHRLALLQAQGPAAVEAALRALPPAQRPVAALLHDDRPGSYAKLWNAKGLLVREQALGYMTLWVFKWGKS